jgi:hypothetical protein
MEFALSICLGIGLSAACGFRIFVPLLGVSMAALSGHLHLAEGFEWLGTWPAFACFLTATALEVGAYYIPWLDNLLDSIATPAAVVAGTIITAAVMTDLSPMLQWTLAIIAGGGTAGLIQAGTTVIRGTSTLTTGGLANFMVSTGEVVMSSALTVAAFVLPLIGAVVALVLAGLFLSRLAVVRARHPQPIPLDSKLAKGKTLPS